ncbi:THAP domain-containing protein 4 [Entomortierella beljakovae]|nr:THAP domain-containing protein 4 [Entomortierella beljakovae]
MSLLILLRNSSPKRFISPVSSSILASCSTQKHFGTTLKYNSSRKEMSTSTDKPRPLEFLIGTWSGKGKGFFPTIPTFEFFEELNFTRDPAGRPVIAYNQKTKRAIAGESEAQLVPGPPLHAECGFIRLPGWSEEECELILSQPTGVASVEVGKIVGTTVSWESTGIIRSPKAKPPHVTAFTR